MLLPCCVGCFRPITNLLFSPWAPCLVEYVFKSFITKGAAGERGVPLWILTWNPGSSTASCLTLRSLSLFLTSLHPNPHEPVPSLSTLPAPPRPQGRQSAGWPALPSHVTGMSTINRHFWPFLPFFFLSHGKVWSPPTREHRHPARRD